MEASPKRADQVAMRISQLGPTEAAELLDTLDDATVLEALQRVNPAVAGDILPELDESRRTSLFETAPANVTQQWSMNLSFEEDSIGRLMEAPAAVFRQEQTVRQATQRVRDASRNVMLTYLFVVDGQGRLEGLVTMRDLVVADDDQRLGEIMLRDVFTLSPVMPLEEAMRLVVHRHYPVYPVIDDVGRLLGQVRGSAMFEEQAFEISAQPGRMVGVAEEERLLTPWLRSLKFRHPWLQLNLVTAFLAAGVVGIFQSTLDEMVILALFLPVLASQATRDAKHSP